MSDADMKGAHAVQLVSRQIAVTSYITRSVAEPSGANRRVARCRCESGSAPSPTRRDRRRRPGVSRTTPRRQMSSSTAGSDTGTPRPSSRRTCHTVPGRVPPRRQYRRRPSKPMNGIRYLPHSTGPTGPRPVRATALAPDVACVTHDDGFWRVPIRLDVPGPGSAVRG